MQRRTPDYEVPKIKKREYDAPEHINVYSDGSLTNTRTNSFKLAGAGGGVGGPTESLTKNHSLKRSKKWPYMKKKRYDLS